jgi:small-conductance mechanosensitive channel
MATTNLLATLDSEIASKPDPTPAPAPEPEVEESSEEETPETDAEGDSEEEAAEEEGEEASPEEEEEPEEGVELDPKAKYLVDGKVVTGEELEKGRLRQADYTRKTQQLAEIRKAADAKISTLEDENEELKNFVQELQNPDDMEFNLRRFFPKQYEDLKDRIIQEALEEHDMTERERELYRENKRAKIERLAKEKDEKFLKQRQERKDLTLKSNELTQQFHQWTLETMEEAGLDPESEEHMDLIRGLASRRKGETWTRETFQQMAAKLAKSLGIKPKAKKAEPTKPESKKESTPKLPPVRTTSAKAPAGRDTQKPKPKPRHVGDAFEELRRKYM